MEDNSSNTTACRLLNSVQWTNRLPPELLSRAFVLGEGMQRGSRALSRPYVGFQDLVTQVCHHWREVAIHTPVLWSYIFISRPPPHQHAELYLTRSGPSCPLDIDIEMKTPYIDEILRFNGDLQADRALQTLQFIVAHGGQLTRWKSLIVLAKATEVIFRTIGLINSGPTPALQYLSLTWKSDLDVMEEQELDALDAASEILGGTTHMLDFGPQRPQLRSVELDGIPKEFVFDRASPLVSNLTHLKLGASFFLPSIQATSALLSASPCLESLFLDVTDAISDIFEPVSVPLQVHLPLLRSFSLHTMTFYDWVLCLLQIVNAPAVEHFELSAGIPFLIHQENPEPLIRFLGAGRINGVLQCDQVLAGQPNCGPIFPSLRHLDLKLHSTGLPATLRLLGAYPMVTQVTLSYLILLALASAPTLLPNVSHLRYYDFRISSFPGAMQKVARARARAGMRISFLEIVFTGRLGLKEWDDDGGMELELDYVTPLGELVGKLDVRDIEPDVPDSDDDIYGSMLGDSDEEMSSNSEDDMDVAFAG